MGEAKRRQAKLTENPNLDRLLPWLPITKTQAETWGKWTNRGTWFCIAMTVVVWVTIRFIGPAFGWWQVV